MEKIKCCITGKEFDSLRGFLNHLRTQKMTSKEYYDTYVMQENENICECGNLRIYGNWKYSKYCGQKCPANIENRLDGVRNTYLGDDREEKLKTRNIKRGKVDINLEKRRSTLKNKAEKLGLTPTEYYSQHAKNGARGISQEKKLEYTLQGMETKAKRNNFGGKSGYVDYVLFDKVISVQGYEPIVLDYLQEKLSNDKLFAGGKSVGYVKYYENDKKRSYFPDAKIFEDTYIEVKSKFTYEKALSNIYAKVGGVFDEGKNILIVVLSKQEVLKNKLDGLKNLLDWAISSQASKDKATIPYVAIYDEGSTTILYGVESNDSKCRGSFRTLRECDIVWSSVKVEAAKAEIE